MLFFDVGCCCCSLFSKFKMLYHCVFVVRFLFITCRVFDKIFHSRVTSYNSVSGSTIFVKDNFNLSQTH